MRSGRSLREELASQIPQPRRRVKLEAPKVRPGIPVAFNPSAPRGRPKAIAKWFTTRL